MRLSSYRRAACFLNCKIVSVVEYISVRDVSQSSCDYNFYFILLMSSKMSACAALPEKALNIAFAGPAMVRRRI